MKTIYRCRSCLTPREEPPNPCACGGMEFSIESFDKPPEEFPLGPACPWCGERHVEGEIAFVMGFHGYAYHWRCLEDLKLGRRIISDPLLMLLVDAVDEWRIDSPAEAEATKPSPDAPGLSLSAKDAGQ